MSISNDLPVFNAMRAELKRQQNSLELIASENFVSEAVMQASGSVMTNKYAEGYPGRRYYGGCEHHDTIEALAIDRAKELFGADHANVQPHSGATANFAAYSAIIKPGAKILAMDLDHGGHLTHGSKVNFSGRLFDVVPYGVNEETHCIDMMKVAALAEEHRPDLIVAGASAYAREIDFAAFGKIAAEQDIPLMVDMAHIAGLVAAGVHMSPVPYADIITTTTHKTLRGPRGGLILCRKSRAKKLNSRVFPGCQGGPLMQQVAAKAVAFGEALDPSFKAYAAAIIENARTLANTLLERGVNLVSGGTDNHIVLLDLRDSTVSGAEAEAILESAGITTNKNKIPFDPEPPTITSGIRLGTPALTTRGMGQAEMEKIGTWIADILASPEDSRLQETILNEVEKLCGDFPLYPSRRL